MGQKWGRPVAALMWIVLFLAGSGSAQAQGTSREDATAGPSAASFISILWGRSNWVATNGPGCVVQPAEARTLEQNAQDLAALGLSATAQVTIDRTSETERICVSGYARQTSWEDLARFRDVYHWSVVSQGQHYADMTQFTTAAERYGETAATLPVFQSHGFGRAWGSLAYANNKRDVAAQTLTTRYFGFGRVYSEKRNTEASVSVFPYSMLTKSVNGGRCHNPALPCYSMSVTNDRQTSSPLLLGSVLNPAPGEWGVVQFYRLVEGRYGSLGQGFAWDCSPSNWQDRWTSQPELYCRNNFLLALDGRNRTAIDTDPTTMAERWGRDPARFLPLGAAPRAR